MDLPTYTNIWRIEKRLYKLYDLRLPMPLPIVWIGVFVGVLVPWTILLKIAQVPFEAPWHVLYLVPPGIVTWLSTRPVIESKRLNELMQSQLRYIGEPKAWCRLSPVEEPDEITFTGRVWRSAPQAARLASAESARAASKARRGTRAKPKHTAPRRRPMEAWGPGRQPPSVKPVARGAVVPGEVRPAVAAAAAAVTSLPPAEAPARVTARPLVAFGGAVAQTAEAASSPALPTASPASSTSLPSTGAPGRALGRAVASPATHPDRSAESPMSNPDRSVSSPASLPDRVVQRPAPKPQLPAAKPQLPVAAEATGSPDVREQGGTPSTAPAPIGTEALRRLRRLAASAEHRGTPCAAAREGVPGMSEGDVPGPRAASPGSGTVIPGRPLAGSASERAAATPEPTLGPPNAPSRPEPTLGDPVGEPARAEAGSGSVSGIDVRELHRKGQPPHPAAATRLPESRTVWPPARTPSAEPPVVPVRPAEPVAPSGPARPPVVPPGPAEPVAPRPVTPDGPAEPVAPRTPVRPAAREQAPPLSIRAVSAASGTTADPAAPSVPVPVPRTGEEPRVRRVESVVGRDQSGGWRRLAQVVVGGGGPSRNEGIETDEARARTVLTGSRRVVVLGCTGGAGQTTTTLMLGHTLARYREDRVLAVDANTGDHTLTGRIPADSPETLTSLLAGLDGVSGYLSMRAYTTRCESGLEVVGSDADGAAARRLADQGLFSDQRLAQAMRVLDRHYRLILVDPAASVAARMLPYADQLILVAPASEDAPDAVAMTFDWLDGHGSTELRRRAIMVVNGVSRRSMGGVEQAEAVARGRCRAIVRIPWEDELAPGHPGPAQLTHLRAGGRRAYVALAGVVASGLAAASRPSEEEVAQ
ncbi:TcpE family conjugal transfer membrane protein [Sphaerisporangium corydalis]|uniref:TcpE family conjugal transfer membrane protein n=1 Tax=Sphaerisporangium corydalis TaxID=1441875 RepID=A0ABV9EEY4_9ACTN|nr:TcpE family conjugal transfer membrane protein [Sphaerisporangium corydalis]